MTKYLSQAFTPHPLKIFLLLLLDPTLPFLNHGSFGATPVPVFKQWQAWQRQRVKFLARDLEGLLQDARKILAAYFHADADDLIHIPNAIFGMNFVARSCRWRPATRC